MGRRSRGNGQSPRPSIRLLSWVLHRRTGRGGGATHAPWIDGSRLGLGGSSGGCIGYILGPRDEEILSASRAPEAPASDIHQRENKAWRTNQLLLPGHDRAGPGHCARAPSRAVVSSFFLISTAPALFWPAPWSSGKPETIKTSVTSPCAPLASTPLYYCCCCY